MKKKNKEYGSSFPIHIKKVSFGSLTLTVNCLLTVFEVKCLIENREGIPIYQQRLVFSKVALENSKTLEHYTIKKEETLYLILHLCGG